MAPFYCIALFYCLCRADWSHNSNRIKSITAWEYVEQRQWFRPRHLITYRVVKNYYYWVPRIKLKLSEIGCNFKPVGIIFHISVVGLLIRGPQKHRNCHWVHGSLSQKGIWEPYRWTSKFHCLNWFKCRTSQINNSLSFTWHRLIHYPKVKSNTMFFTNIIVRLYFLMVILPFAMSKQKIYQKLSGYSIVPPSPGDMTQIANSVNDGVQGN